ncbi:sigma-70 family RNA polymerase sigma factor [Lysobacter aestuarii]|uniref:RNA polymerase sigma factor n=1 Tax=Marilutibacter aestuarii TaxID=1706195 RepID=A0A508AC65_9GAMM|nr:sigma-70 family RNA polymerase sigma factor [Lysobacter aestuarii]
MATDPDTGRVAAFGPARRLNRSRQSRPDDAGYWAGQIARVAQQQDRECFLRIHDHFAPRLQRYMLGLGVAPAQAEELVQDVMLKVWRRARLFDPTRAHFSTWLFRIARNLHIDHLRRQPHWLPVDDGLEYLERQETDRDDEGPDAVADHACLGDAIDQLPAAQARLLRMSYLESKSHSEIASELGMPLGTVKSNLRRSFEKLKDALRPSL